MTQSIVRYILGLAFGYFVGKGIVTQAQANSMLPDLIQDFSLVIGGAVLIFWSYFQKKALGVLPFFKNLGGTPPVRLLPFALALGLGACALSSCASLSSSPALTDAEAFVWTVANQYEKANTGGVLTQAIASSILTATKSSPKTTQQVLAATALADKVAATGVAAHDAGASPSGVIAAQTAVLADPSVISAIASLISSK